MPILKRTSTSFVGVVCVLLIVAVNARAAQNNAGVSGAIRDATGAVLSGATVTLRGPETRQVHTGPSGEFGFGELKPGEYVLRVDAPGFSSIEQTLRVGDGRTAPLVIMLDVSASEGTIVTASRTGASDMQSLPMAVSAVSGRELDRTQTRSIERAVSLMPSVTFTQNSTFGQLSIRGVGANLPNAGGDPSSAIYLDGVYLARPAMVFMDLLDLERIEVLRGPQGTLYGRNAVGGALQLISRSPSTEFEAGARIAAGSFGGLRGEGRVSGALKRDAILGSFAMARAVRDGYVHDLSHPQHPLGGDDVWSARGQLRFLFNGNTDLLLSGDYGDQQGIPLTYNRVLQVKPGFTIDNPPDLHDVRTSTPAAGRVTQHGASARVNAALSPTMQVTSLTAWRGLKNDFYVDADVTELDLFAARSEERQHQWSQELTVTQTRQRATWVGGVFLMGEHDRQSVRASQPQARVDVLLNPTVDARSTAAFGELTVRATPGVSAIVGARYSRERKTIDNAGGRYTLDQPPQLLGGQYAYVDRISHAAWTPKIGVDWTPRPGALLYATATRGFKSGGFNWSSPAPGRGFAPEFAWSYEGGLKTVGSPGTELEFAL